MEELNFHRNIHIIAMAYQLSFILFCLFSSFEFKRATKILSKLGLNLKLFFARKCPHCQCAEQTDATRANHQRATENETETKIFLVFRKNSHFSAIRIKHRTSLKPFETNELLRYESQ